jgi:hypothetical protein
MLVTSPSTRDIFEMLLRKRHITGIMRVATGIRLAWRSFHTATRYSGFALEQVPERSRANAESTASFIVHDHDKQALSYDRPTIGPDTAHARGGIPYRGEHCQAAKRSAADIEGHSKAAKFGQSRRLSAKADGRWSTNCSDGFHAVGGNKSPVPGTAGN